MRKRLIVIVAVAAALACCVPASAAIFGTAHDQATGSQGDCSACHIPHKALGPVLWPASMEAFAPDFGVVGSLCYYCHGIGGGAGLPYAVQILIMDATIGEFSHGRDPGGLTSRNDSVDASLPYGSRSPFECTTCHEVHDDSNRPFLQDDIDVLCARCHDDRQFVDGTAKPVQGDWGDAYGLLNPGSHPMGTDVYDDSDQNSPVDLTDAGVFNLPYGVSEGYNLGGHLIDGVVDPGNGNGMTCVTCHAVHGTQLDFDPPIGGTPASPNLLVIPQPTDDGPYDGTVYNGNGDPSNALCEACHTGFEQQTMDAGTGAAYTGEHSANPGAISYTHPADDLGAAGSFPSQAFPVDWPIGSSSGLNSAYSVICESCHTPHPAANIDRETILAASGTHILRASEDPADPQYICTQCHDLTGAGIECHPANVPMGRMFDPDIGNGDEILTCTDCHFTRAHNWTGSEITMDPDWEPAGNGRGPEELERTSANTSKECEDCHYSDNTLPGPTNNDSDDSSPVTHSWRTSSGYQDIGEGTHYLGSSSMDFSLGLFNGIPFNATTDYWTGQGQPNPRWSRFDGELGHVVCESCHELESDKNVPGTALLLAQYSEGGTGPDDDPSGLCEGCHGHSPGGGGTPHPMTGDIVSRTGLPLDTGSQYIRPAGPEGNATFSGVDGIGMNCDSCHQPHDADTEGGTYIYESGEGVPDEKVHDVTGVPLPDGNIPTNYRGFDVEDLQDAPFCDSCHFYLD